MVVQLINFKWEENMEKLNVLSMAKEDLKKVIDEIKLQTIEETEETVNKYFQFLRNLNYLKSDDITKETFKAEKNRNYVENKSNNKNMNETKVSKENIYKFERKLRGGFIPEIEAYIPEGIVRKLTLEHGDLVTAKEMNADSDDNKYYYELIEKGDRVEAENRSEWRYCLIEKDGNTLMAKRTLEDGGDDIRLDGVPYTLLIKDEEIMEFNLKEGDIIDISYARNNPQYYKVIWKHLTEQQTYNSPFTSGFYKEKTSKNKDKVEKTLKNKKVLVIGCEPRKSLYKQHVEERGGEFYWAEGTEGKKRLSSLIKKSDKVILLIRFIRHQASYDVVEICKQINKPFSIVETLGIETVIKEAVEGETA